MAQVIIPRAPDIAANSYVLLDAQTGQILVEENADEPLPPASLTKIMTAYIAIEEIINGNLELTDKVHISEKAWRMEGSKMFVDVNSQVSIEDLLRGIIIQSGNDASVAISEHIAGS
ncbi:MAG: serine hydrolase, partial [Pseudomonadota bacterium]|nr:serine hydrolase [Pseudomonadota bacterium]